jgi:hypothetical protein
VPSGLTLALWDFHPQAPHATMLAEFLAYPQPADDGSAEIRFHTDRAVSGARWFEMRRDGVPMWQQQIRTMPMVDGVVTFPRLDSITIGLE